MTGEFSDADLQRAYELEDAGNLEAAEAIYRSGDLAGSVSGSGNLGRLLRDRGELAGAEAAFRRAVERGSIRAIADLAGVLLGRGQLTRDEIIELVDLLCTAQDEFVLFENMQATSAMFLGDMADEQCDPDAVEAGYRRADARGSATGAWHAGWALGTRGHLAGAAEAFRRAIDRGDARAWTALSDTYLQWDDRARAESVAREGDAAGAANASLTLGKLLEQSGDKRAALEAYRRADARGDGEGSLRLGTALADHGELSEAQSALERAVVAGIDGAEPALERVRQVALRSDPAGSDSLWKRGVRAELLGDVKAAIDAYNAAYESGEQPEEHRALLRYAEILERSGDPLAEETFHRVTDSNEPDLVAGAWRAVANFRMARSDLNGAVAALEHVVSTEDRDEAPRAWRNLGAIREDIGDIVGARTAYRAAIEADHPMHSPGARVNLAQLLEREGDFDGASALLREVIASDHPVAANRARVLWGFMLQSRGQQWRAVELWEAAAAAGDDEWAQRGAANAGFVYFEAEDIDRAVPLLRLGTGLADQQAAGTAYFFLGLCEIRLGNRDAARTCFRQVAETATGELQSEAARRLALT